MEQSLYSGRYLWQFTHPDLLEKQAIQGAENSYRQASKNLNAESCSRRPVNSIESIRKSSKKVAQVVGDNKLKTVGSVAKLVESAKLLFYFRLAIS